MQKFVHRVSAAANVAHVAAYSESAKPSSGSGSGTSSGSSSSSASGAGSGGTWSLFRAAIMGLRSKSADEKGRVLSKEWIAHVRAKNPAWTDAFAETVTEEWVAEGSKGPNTKLRDYSEDDTAAVRRASSSPSGQLHKDLDSAGVSRFALAVADDVDVQSFACRYGVRAPLVHRLSERDHPVVGWLRSNGATVIGKLRTVVPFALNEAIHYTKFPAATALQCGACDVALVTSIFGVAASNAPVVADVVSFTPSATTFPRGSPPFSRKRSMAIVMRDLADLHAFWAELSGTSTSSALQQQQHQQATASGGSSGGAASAGRGGDDDPDDPPTVPSAASLSSSGASSSSSGRSSSASSTAALHVAGGVRHSSITTSGDDGGLIVGVPVEWINLCFANGELKDAGSRFLDAYKDFAASGFDRRGTTKRRAWERDIEVRPVAWIADPDEVLTCARTIAHYELAESLQRNGRSLDGTGLLDQLPAGIVSAIFDGRHVGDAAYTNALLVRDELGREFVEEAGEVDCVVMPIVSPPFQTHNLRSAVTTLPVALSSCPSLSLRVQLPGFAGAKATKIPAANGSTNELPVMIAVEPGMDSALIDVVNDFFR